MKSVTWLGTVACALFAYHASTPFGDARAATQATSAPVASVSTGQLRGNLTSHGVAVFKNIPFAEPPVGNLRWREGVPAKAWTGVRDARTFGPACVQSGHLNATSSEDCLQLNIWTPNWPMKARVPVMVWFHGGGNTAGSGVEPLFDGETLARHGVVLVTTNYRLGVFGFFVHPELTKEPPSRAAGNYGLLDQLQALRWVRDNIAKFGGDPANVTIFGESAGAGDVNTLIASPLSKGLFVRVIAQSGPVGNPTTLADAEKRGVDFAAKLGFTGDGALARLRALSSAELLEKVGQGGGGPGAAATGPTMSIVVDGRVLPESSQKIFAEGRQQKVRLLIGSNSQEMQGGTGGRGPASSADLRQLIAQRYGPLADRAASLYGLGGGGEPAPHPQYGNVLTQWTTDTSFRCGTVQELVWHTASGNPGYQYEFSRTVHGQEALGAPHAAEIPFVFGTLPVWQERRKYTDSDQTYAVLMQQYWTNFAKTGDPNGSSLPKWPTFDATRRAYLDFTDAGPVAKEGLRREICDLFMENQKRQMAK
jgi:para-nitrobenzyl esterase